MESYRSWILFTAQYRAGYRNQIRKTTWRIISIYNRLITLTLFYSSIANSSWVFIPKVFPRPYPPIYQTPSTQITCWTHWFNQDICFFMLICTIYHQTITIAIFMRYCPSYLNLKYSKKRQQYGKKFLGTVHHHARKNWSQKARY